MVTLTLRGTYQNGQFLLDQPVHFAEPVEVVVIFLELKQEKRTLSEKFSFRRSLALTQHAKGSLSEAIIEERRIKN